MHLVTVNKTNQGESKPLIEQYHVLLKKQFGSYLKAKLDLALLKGETIFLLLDNGGKVVAGLLMQKNYRDFRDGVHLPIKSGAVGYVYNLVANPDCKSPLMPGLELQKIINREFKNKAGAFAHVEGKPAIDILAANVVQRNIQQWYQAAREAGLRMTLNPSPVNEHGHENAYFVAAAADPNVELVPKMKRDEVLMYDPSCPDKDTVSDEVQRLFREFKNNRKRLPPDRLGR